MASVLRPISVEEAAGILAGSSSTVSGAKVVRAVNTAGTTALITVLADDQSTVIGTMTVNGNSEVLLHKLPTEYVFASAATVLLSAQIYPRG